AAVAITTAMRDDDDCEEGCEKCIPLHAGAGGIPKRMPYANERNSRVGYEYQHHVVNWFFHDPIARIIMEWEFNGVEFDGLDPTRGTLLAGRGIARAEYDPAGVARCYLIDTKYGYEIYVRYDAWEERWVVRQLFFWGGWQKELTGQSDAIESSHPNVMLIWIFSNLQVMQVAKEVLNEVSQGKVATVYYSYIAQEDRAE
nr:restriction endonuclease fold toxin 5 domain-containing protein [Paracoccaceae bacterium]